MNQTECCRLHAIPIAMEVLFEDALAMYKTGCSQAGGKGKSRYKEVLGQRFRHGYGFCLMIRSRRWYLTPLSRLPGPTRHPLTG